MRKVTRSGKALCTLALCLTLVGALAGCQQSTPAAGTPVPTASSAAIPTATAMTTPITTPTETATHSPSPVVSPTPTPEPELAYTFDPYVLPADAKVYIGDLLPDYKKLVDAVLKRKKKIELPKKSLEPAISCLYSDFPLSVLLRDYTIDEKTSMITLVYNYDKEEHAKRIQAFEDRVEQVIRSAVSPSYNEFETALALYRWTAKNITYTPGDDVSPYHALMDGVGICQSYTGLYSFLLLQLGLDPLECGSFMSNGDAHVWVLLTFGDTQFHLDPTFESNETKGEGLRYFGMDDTRRLDSGAVLPFSTGVYPWSADAPVCEDARFAFLAACTRWELDADEHRLLLNDGIGEDPYASLDTTTYETTMLQDPELP